MNGSSPVLKELNLVRGKSAPQSTIIAVGAGKGGVGKSFLSSSLAVLLSHYGFETLLVDLDLGAGNVHTCIGEGMSSIGVNEFLRDPQLTLAETITPTRIKKLKLITANSEALDAANVTEDQKSRLMSALYSHPSDYIVLDLSAGTHDATLDFFLMAQKKIVVFTPEPTSVENAYRFMKSAFYRRLRRYEHHLHLESEFNHVMIDKQRYGIRNPADLLRIIGEKSPDRAEELSNVVNGLDFNLIVNQCRSMRDNELGPQIKSVCHKYFGVPCDLLGHLEYDNAVWQSLRKRRPLVIEYPHSRLYAQLSAIARRVVGTKIHSAAG